MARQGGRGVRIAGPPARRPISFLEKIWAIGHRVSECRVSALDSPSRATRSDLESGSLPEPRQPA